MGSVIRVQFLDKALCVSLWTDALDKGMNPSFLLCSYRKIAGQIGFFSLGKATSLGEK